MSFSPGIEKLISALRCLPGVGAKSAQRMAFHLLARNRNGGAHLAKTLAQAMEQIGHCTCCRTFCETALCQLCASQRRNRALLCIVGSPADMIAMEQTGYQGLYFVLLGHLSPIDGIGPSELGIEKLRIRLQTETIEEIILATNTTVEGEATAHYIAQLAKKYHIPCSRIAHGVPLGGELEYIDGGTLSRALASREVID